MVMPGIIWFAVFAYYPMYGATLAFKRFSIGQPLSSAQWIGISHFQEFFRTPEFWLIMRNTLAISIMKLILCFPMGIIFALLLNELTQLKFKKLVQTVSYLPHFVSWVVVGSLTYQMLGASDGAVNALLQWFRIVDKSILFMANPRYFWWVVVVTENWKETGWSAIIYLAAITAIDPQLYEAASIDGMGRLKQVFYITIPCISGTIMVLFIFAVAGILNSNFDQIWLLRNNTILQTAEVIDTHVFRVGIQQARYDYATAVGLFKAVLGLFMLFFSNTVVKRITGTGGIF